MTDEIEVTQAEQVADQFLAVAALARNIAIVHEEIAPFVRSNVVPDLLSLRGGDSAELMETLGNILNNMDAVDAKADGWLAPIFKRTHEMFPPQAASTANAELAEARAALDMCRCIIKFHVKDAGVCCSFEPHGEPFSALKAHDAAREAIARIDALTGETK